MQLNYGIIHRDKFSSCTNIIFSVNAVKGRHVVANTDIKMGDTIFVEKAFIFAPIYGDNFKFTARRCYDCLDSSKSFIP